MDFCGLKFLLDSLGSDFLHLLNSPFPFSYLMAAFFISAMLLTKILVIASVNIQPEKNCVVCVYTHMYKRICLQGSGHIQSRNHGSWITRLCKVVSTSDSGAQHSQGMQLSGKLDVKWRRSRSVWNPQEQAWSLWDELKSFSVFGASDFGGKTILQKSGSFITKVIPTCVWPKSQRSWRGIPGQVEQVHT